MALTHVATVRNELADTVVDHFDDGTGDGKIRIYTTGFGSLLVDIDLNDPAFGDASAGVATGDVTPTPEGTATQTGTAAVFRATDSDNNEIFNGTVTATGGGGDMELSSLSISTNDAVRINSMTYTAPQ